MEDLLEFSPAVLEWAAIQSGKTVGEIASKISKKKPEEIQYGKMSPSQAARFAKLAGVPFGYLFLDTPPESRVNPIADFRTISNATPLSKDFFAMYDDIDFKQSWYKDLLKSLGAEPLPFVAKFSTKSSAEEVALDMRKTLGISFAEIAGLPNSDAVFSYLSGKAEDSGILIFKNSQAGNNWRRALQVAEFRGFVLSDKFAPAIFINGSDAPAAWVFTLAHELAHIWFGDSGVSDIDTKSANKHERLCNAVAAEFLVPAREFKRVWDERDVDVNSKLELAKKSFKVSLLVIARRAFELDLIPSGKYSEIYQVVRNNAAKPKDSEGGDYYRTLPIRNSRRLTNQVARLAATGGISFREAGQLLNTNPNNVMTYYAKNSNSLST
ncbi:MAG: ImmA/IrrE family metallo-endopeptidase [Burkholderiales bacterium]|nr:ImmA/IrrE family metallo-endopeptidase [Burkholderiales bacterium]